MGRMSDVKLAEACKEYKKHKAASDQLKADILDELNRRGVAVGDDPIASLKEKHGVTLRKMARAMRFYDVPLLKKTLKPRQRELVIYEAVRVSALDELVDAGQVSADDVKSCLDHVDTSEPYIGVWLSRT